MTTGYLTTLAARTLGVAPLLAPPTPGRFEPAPATSLDGGATGLLAGTAQSGGEDWAPGGLPGFPGDVEAERVVPGDPRLAAHASHPGAAPAIPREAMTAPHLTAPIGGEPFLPSGGNPHLVPIGTAWPPAPGGQPLPGEAIPVTAAHPGAHTTLEDPFATSPPATPPPAARRAVPTPTPDARNGDAAGARQDPWGEARATAAPTWGDRAAQRSAATAPTAAPAPRIVVRIGRVEVRAVAAPAASGPVTSARHTRPDPQPSRVPTLAEYLQARDRGRR